MGLLMLAACGSSQTQPAPQLRLSSAAFPSGGSIPARFSCDGPDQAPPIEWSGAPQATRSFALVVDDPDAPAGTFHHWGVFGIPAAAHSVAGGTAVTNDFGKSGYSGPCPPKGGGMHHYHFKLFALDTDKLPVSAASKVADIENAARSHAIAQREIVGTYERK
jgi:hypothetical protein